MIKSFTFSLFCIVFCLGVTQSQSSIQIDSVGKVGKDGATVYINVLSKSTSWTGNCMLYFLVSPDASFSRGMVKSTERTKNSAGLQSMACRNLRPDTEYHVKAIYRKNTAPKDSVFSNVVSFRTLPAIPSEHKVDTVLNIGISRASFYGRITKIGDMPSQRCTRGFVFGLEPNPTISTSASNVNFVKLDGVIAPNALPFLFHVDLPPGSLLGGRTYYVRTFFVSRFDTTYSESYTFNVKSPCGFPPINLREVGVERSKVSLLWSGAEGQSIFEIDCGPLGHEIGTGDLFTVSNVPDTSDPYTISNLRSGVLYAVAIRAKCADSHSVWSLPISFTTKPDPCPPSSNLRVEGMQTTSAIIAWTPGNMLQKRWEVVLSKKGSSTSKKTIVESPKVFLTVLERNASYKIKVRSLCDSLKSTWTPEFEFKTNLSSLPTPQQTAKIELSIDPNPTQGFVSIQTGGKKIIAVRLIDAMGKVLMEKKHIEGNTLDLSPFAKGIYFLQVQTEDGLWTGRVVRS